MDPASFFAASRVLIVAGKGGVGKTTVAAALSRAAALSGLTSLVVEVDGRSGLAGLFGQPAFDYREVTLVPGGGPEGAGDVRARTLTPDDALLEYLQDHGMSRIARRLATSGALDVVATAAPGIEDILILGKVKQLERGGSADLVVLDAPAAGHAISFLRSPRGLLDTARAGPIHTQAADVAEMLSDPQRCQVLLVTLAEETPVNELVETAYSLEDEVGVKLGPIIVNGLYEGPDLAGLHPSAAAAERGVELAADDLRALSAAAAFRSERTSLQEDQLARLAGALPLPQIHLPQRFTADLGPDDVEALAVAFAEGVEALPAP